MLPHPKPSAKSLQPLRRRRRRRLRRSFHHLRDLLQQQRPVQRVHLPVFPVPQPAVVELVRIFRLHQRDRLLELIKVLLEDGVLQGGDEVGEEVDVDA